MQVFSSSWAAKHLNIVMTIMIVGMVVISIIIIIIYYKYYYYHHFYNVYLVVMQVRQYLMEGNRQDVTRQAIINITEEAFWNLKSACSNTG